MENQELQPLEPVKFTTPSQNTLTFHLTEDGEFVEVLKINKDGFFYRGEKVEDVHQVYERFNEWLTKSLKTITND